MMFGAPEEKREKKIRRIARNGSYGLGGGAGLWFLNALYPHEKEADHVAALFGQLALVMILYGAVTLATVLFKKEWAGRVHFLLLWVILPTLLVVLFTKAWPG